MAKKIFSPPPPNPQFAADTLPAPRPLSLLETPLLGFSMQNRTPPPRLPDASDSPSPSPSKKNRKYPKRPPRFGSIVCHFQSVSVSFSHTFKHIFKSQNTPEGRNNLKKNQDLPLGLKFSSEKEKFKRATHHGPFLWGILKVKIEIFKRIEVFSQDCFSKFDPQPQTKN